MKLDEEGVEINHMVVDYKGETHSIFCTCWEPDLASKNKSILTNIGFQHFDNPKAAIDYGWSISSKETFICPECTNKI